MKIKPHQIHPSHIFEIDKKIANALLLNQELSNIVEAELKSGNLISDISTGWPEDKSVVVSFSKKISSEHSLSKNIEYSCLNDPHYWTHQYTTKKPIHMVIG